MHLGMIDKYLEHKFGLSSLCIGLDVSFVCSKERRLHLGTHNICFG